MLAFLGNLVSDNSQMECRFCGKPLGMLQRWRTPGYCSADHRQQHSLHHSAIFNDPVVAPPEPEPEAKYPILEQLRSRALGQRSIVPDPLLSGAEPEPEVFAEEPLPEIPAVEWEPAAETVEEIAMETEEATAAEPEEFETLEAPVEETALPVASLASPILDPLPDPLPEPEPEQPPAPAAPAVSDISAEDFFRNRGRAEPPRPQLVRLPRIRHTQDGKPEPGSPKAPIRRTGSE